MHKNYIKIPSQDYLLNNLASGHIKIWTISSDYKESKLLAETKNTIVKEGADILAAAVSGKPNSAITHFYVGYRNATVTPSEEAAITIDDGLTSFRTDAEYGYIRIPLAFPPVAGSTAEGYGANVPYFTTFIVNGGQWLEAGQAFQAGSNIYALGLVNASNAGSASGDKLFSRAYLSTPIEYDPLHGLAITWGIVFKSITPQS